MRFGSLAWLLSLPLVFSCGDTDPTSEGSAQKTCVAPDCCFSDDDCADGEYCDGEGPCDSEGTCKLHVTHPCPIGFDPETHIPHKPVCGCDGITYTAICNASTSGVRIAHAGMCEAAPCFSNADCAEGDYCAGDGGCESEGVCTKRITTPCGVILDPETGEFAEPMLCACDGNAYLTACNVRNAGTRIDPTDECRQDARAGL